MTRPKHPLLFAFAAVCATATLAACSPAPEPTPTKTPIFASEEEAFEAAEATYQAYTDATNATNLSDPKTFEPVFDWLTGSAKAAEQRNYSFYYAEGVRRSGITSIDTFTPIKFEVNKVEAKLCADVSNVDLIDSGGRSLLPTGRATRVPIGVIFVGAPTSTGLWIQSNYRPEDFKC
ncbi:hypothetical protein [Microbacterium sp.]|uniref:hypothetical protein n=1 Tax=Microbacterium sp. TaxID=51671 RepID=UPI00333F5E64